MSESTRRVVTPRWANQVRHVAEFLDVDVHQVAGLVVFVAADRFAGATIEVGEPVESAPA
ncbi:hypothetical protein Ade02nite_17610 [Paractinoplanes deccanensis]|uniref:Uncharacterized protein n=1 Tax=Paractinoplanes deccanensis TaxID=113561 RepID=A0ABQ3XZF1_9ACTN|nr:hypothetical protein Ade02nite_17610 [Actinoplanes deccanensis]